MLVNVYELSCQDGIQHHAKRPQEVRKEVSQQAAPAARADMDLLIVLASG